MELIFVVAKLICGVLYEALRLIFIVIDKFCKLIANLIKSPEKREADMLAAMEARHKEGPSKPLDEVSFDDMFSEDKEAERAEREKRNEIDIEF